MKRASIPVLLTLALLLLAGCRSTDILTGSDSGSGDATPPTADAVPAGTEMSLRLNEQLGTENSDVGDEFTATVATDLVAETGDVAIPAGATVHGSVTGVDPSDNVGDQAAIRLAFDRIEVRGDTYPYAADIVAADVQERSDDNLERNAAIGAGIGAALGLILEGDLLDALIGGALGAGVGTAISLGTGDVDAVLPAGTMMRVETERRIDLR